MSDYARGNDLLPSHHLLKRLNAIGSLRVILYAQQPRVRNRQIVRDAVVAGWCLFWIRIGQWIFDFISRLGGVGHSLQNTSERVSGGVDDLPGLLRSVGGPFNSISDGLNNAGTAQVNAVHDIALFFALLVSLGAIVPVLTVHVARRLIWMRRVSAIIALSHSPHFAKLMAERALLRQPLYKLASVSQDPVEDIKNGEYSALAALELADSGVKAPT